MSTTARRRVAALGVLVPFAGSCLLAAAGPAGAVAFEGDPGTTHCVRLVTWTELTGDPVPPGRPHPALVAVLVPLAEC